MRRASKCKVYILHETVTLLNLNFDLCEVLKSLLTNHSVIIILFSKLAGTEILVAHFYFNIHIYYHSTTFHYQQQNKSSIITISKRVPMVKRVSMVKRGNNW